MGVWIETAKSSLTQTSLGVTPFVGVWIETYYLLLWVMCGSVTPFVGVWIETALPIGILPSIKSHPSWVCGLKPILWYDDIRKYMSHPSWVCGLKQKANMDFTENISHTLRGCVD